MIDARDPRHGTRAGYLAHRRAGEEPCEPCARGFARACKEYRLRTGGGVRTIRRPASEAIAIFEQAEARGITSHALCVAAGLSTSQGSRVRQSSTVTPTTLLRLRQALETAVSGCVDADLTRKRIRSLQRQGWPARVIGEMTGHDIYSGKWRTSPTIRRDLAEAVRDLCKRIGDRRGPSRHAASLAARKGWLPLAGWDDPGTLAWPAESTEVETLPKLRRRELMLSEWEHLSALGVSIDEAAQRLGVTPKAIEKAAERARKDAA